MRSALGCIGIGTGRGGYRRVSALLQAEGWRVNHKRVERIWRQEGLKVPHKQPKRGRLWLNDGSTLRLRSEFAKHVWSYDFMQDRTYDGKIFRILNIIPTQFPCHPVQSTLDCADWRPRQDLAFGKVLCALSWS